MAVEDPQQPPQQQPSQTVQRLIKAAAAGEAAKTAVGAAAAPAVAVTLPAQAAVGTVKVPAELFVHGVKIAIILRILRRLLQRHHAESADWLTKQLRKEFPNADPAWIRDAVEKELAYEQAFQQKAMKRTEASLQQAGSLPTPEAQQKRVQGIIDREKHYAGLREKAMLNRAKAHVANQSVKAISPEGAKWVLGNRKNHTLGCLALAGKNWPWAVLDMIPPPLHAQCGCELVPLKPGETVLPVSQAIPMAKAAMALEEAIRRTVSREEIDVMLAERVYEERLEEVKWQDWLHPRGRGGKWIDKLGPTGHLPGLEPEHEKAGEKPKPPSVPKPDPHFPKLSPGSVVVSGPPPEGEAFIGGNVPEPAKQGPIPDFSHVALKLQLPPAFGADHVKAKGQDQDFLIKEHGGDRSRVASELLANGIYRELGVGVPEMGHVKTHAVPDWSKRAEDLPHEPPVDAPKGTRISVGVVLRDPDGRVTLIEPRNHYGGTIHGFPKGGQEPNLTLQQGAHKELWEESGLHGHITDVIGDFKGDTGVTRYYLGVRTGGEPTPSDETVAVKTVTPDEAKQMLNKQRDQDVLKAVLEKPIPEGTFEDETPPEEPGSALAFAGVPGKTRDITEPNEALGKGYMADALVANRDFLGQRGGNVRWQDDQTPIRTNMASTFGYGGSGMHDFGKTPEEIWTMRYRGQAAGTIAAGEEQLRQQAADISRILTNAKIDQLTKAAGFPDPKERKRIADTLKARVAWMKRFAAGEESLPQPASGAEARAAFADAQSGFEIYPEEHQALGDYAGDLGRSLDGHLRGGKGFTDDERKLAKRLDGLLDATSAPVDSYVYMGADAAPNKGMVGKTFSMASYTRAHTDRHQASGNAHVRLLVPGGARAMHLEDAEKGQPDMLLPRDQRMQITGLSTGPDGKPTLEGIVLPYRRPRSLPSDYKPPSYTSPMSQTKIKGLSAPKGEFFAKGDRVDVNGNKATVTGDAGKGMANVKLDNGKGYTVPFNILKRLEEASVDGWVRGPDGTLLREAFWKEFLHPRGRGGEWIEGVHTPRQAKITGLPKGAAPVTKAPPVGASIARLEALGLDVKPPKPNISKLSDQEVSDIADAFEEAFKQYPILQHGPGRHVGVVEFCSNVKVKKLKGGTLADTGAGLFGGGTSEKALTPRTRIRINDLTPHHMAPAGPPQPGAATGGQLCPASQSWKGCTWHELGHAMMEAIDMAGHHDAKRYVDWMSRYGVTFDDCKGVSTYAVASRSEGIAELCAMQNTPGYSGLLTPEMQGKVEKMFEDLKNWDLGTPYAYHKPLPGAVAPAQPLPKIKATAPKPKLGTKYAMPSAGKLAEIEAAVKANPGIAGDKQPVGQMALSPGDVFEGHTPGLRYLVISDPSEKSGLRYVPLNQGKGDAYRFSSTSKRRKVNLHFDLSEAAMPLDVSPETLAKVDEVAAKNIAAGDWVEPDPFLDQNDPAEPLDEAVYTEALHPRGRGGKWIGKPGGRIRRAVEAPDESPVGRIVGSLAGKTGDAGYQALASGQALDTQKLHQVDGKYTAARKLLHQSIINHFFEKAQPAEGKPKAIFTAGGAASGKSGLAGQAREAASNLDIPKGAVYINPDDIKEMIPEYNELKRRGREDVAAAATHEESSDLAKLMTAIAMDGHYPVIVDGTGDSKIGKFGDKLRAAQKAGYDVEARYAHVPVGEAISREKKRAERTGRKVAESLLRNQHKTVAQSYTNDVVNEPGVHVKVYSTVERGQPKMIAEKPAGGAVKVIDQKQYDEHLAKAEA